MKKYINPFYWIAMAGLLVWFSYTKGWILADFESIDAPTAIHLIQSDDNITVLDVRTIQEFKEGHLQNATLLPLQSLVQNINMLQNSKKKKIFVYCHSGNRSVAASRILDKNGFTPVNIKGGIIALTEAGANVVK